MKSRILTVVFSMAIGLGFLSCQKQEEVKPNVNPNKIPVRIAKSMNTTGLAATNDGFTSYVITTSEGYSYTVTFQEVDGYTSLVVTNPGGTSAEGACINRIIAILEKWINAQQELYYNQDNACSVVRSFINDLRTLEDCVPAEAQEDFDEALDEVDEALDGYCD
jgi:hypothetical protein